jgi:hypothetical protein
MGHYYSEMMCDECGKIVCVCPKKPIKQKWVVDKNKWIAREEYPFFNIDDVFAKRYSTKEEAEESIPEEIAKRRDELLAEADLLDMMLTLVPGETNICPKCYEIFCFCNGGYR